MNEFGKALKSSRKSQQITLSQLGEIVGKSVGYLSDLEQGRKKPPADKIFLVNIEAALNIQSGYLQGLAEQIRKMPEDLVRQSTFKPKLTKVLLQAGRDLNDGEFEALIKLLEDGNKQDS